MKNKRKSYETKLEADLKKWSKKIVLLESNVKHAGEIVKTDYLKAVKKLNSKRAEGASKLKELRSSEDEAFLEVKKDAGKIWSDLKKSYNDAVSIFKQGKKSSLRKKVAGH